MKKNVTTAVKPAAGAKTKSKIKIYVTCLNNRIAIPDNSLFELVQGGTANATQRLPGMLHDDEGDNISVLNPRFNDAGTMYWAWKNFDNDYYGFFQYRRFLSFDTEMLKEKQYEYPFDTNDEKAFEKLHLTDENEMRAYIEKYDIITCNYLQYSTNYYTLYQQYYEGPISYEKDLDLLLEIIQEKYPEYMPAVRESLFKNGKGYFANLFIMKKAYFQRLCQWMFDILFEVDRRIDYSGRDAAECRAPAFLSERLIGIFYTYLEMETDCKFGTLQKCIFKTTREKPLDPVFENRTKTVPIVLAAGKQYLPYCGVTVRSVLDHALPERFYDIVILHEDITNYAIKRFCEGLTGDHVSVRFVNVASYMAGQRVDEDKLLDPKETYYRCFMGDVMARYDKAIYLDSDVIALRDMGELLDTELKGGAVGIGKDENGELQPGVFIFDVEKYRQLIGCEYLPAYLKQKRKASWREMFSAAVDGFAMVMDMGQWAIHYAGQRKPWRESPAENGVFWEAAERSPLYQDIRDRLAMKRWDRYFPGYVPEKKQDDDTSGVARTDKQENKSADPEAPYIVRPWESMLDDIPFPKLDIFPAFEENNVAVLMLSSQYYVPYMAVTIQSLVESGNRNKNYDIIVLTDDIPMERQGKLQRVIDGYSNVSIRVVSIKEYLALVNDAQLPQYTRLGFCRVWLAHILANYDQVICVDCDMIVTTDISVFENYDFGDDLILAAHEWCYEDSYGKTLGLEDYRRDAFNAGFMIQNLKAIRQSYSARQLIDFCNARKWNYMDQDVLNVLFQGRIQYLTYDWNYRVDYLSLGALHITESCYSSDYKILKPKVLHFGGPMKPWQLSGVKYEETFWNVAERSVFYGEILRRFVLMRSTDHPAKVAPPLPNLIPVNHPARKMLDVFLPKGSRRREFVKHVVRVFKQPAI